MKQLSLVQLLMEPPLLSPLSLVLMMCTNRPQPPLTLEQVAPHFLLLIFHVIPFPGHRSDWLPGDHVIKSGSVTGPRLATPSRDHLIGLLGGELLRISIL